MTPEAAATSIRLAATTMVEQLDVVTGQVAQQGLARVRANASGRPGPRRITGDYLRTMSVETPALGVRTIGTNAVQARRLEYGFYNMRDRLGRLFFQRPLPHWTPMADWIEPVYSAAVAVITEKL